MKKFLVSLCVVAGIAAASAGIYAQSNPDNGVVAPGSGLQISPTRIPGPDSDKLVAQPGETITVEMTVRNVTQSPVTATGLVNDFLPSEDETGAPRIILDQEEETERGLRTYVEEVPSVRLEPGEAADVSIEIDVPTNATPGGHYGIIRYTSDPDSQDDGNVTLSASLGTIVLVEVAGEIYEDVSLLELSAATLNDEGEYETGNFFTGSVFQDDDLAVVTRMQNNGNTHAAPYGNVIVKNMIGNVVEDFELNDARGNVLPDSTRRFVNELENSFFFGRYTVEAHISYTEGGGDIITQQASFWVLPWKIMLVAVAVIAVVIIGGRKGLRSYNRRIVSKSRRS